MFGLNVPSIDWIEVVEMYQDIWDQSRSEGCDWHLSFNRRGVNSFIMEMYSLSDDWSDFTPLELDTDDNDIPF